MRIGGAANWEPGTAARAKLDTRAGAREIRAMSTLPRIVLSRFDQERLERLLSKVGPRPDLDALREEIERAEIVEPEDVPGDVVTMNSVVRFVDEESNRESEITLVFPGQADVDSDLAAAQRLVGGRRSPSTDVEPIASQRGTAATARPEPDVDERCGALPTRQGTRGGGSGRPLPTRTARDPGGDAVGRRARRQPCARGGT